VRRPHVYLTAADLPPDAAIGLDIYLITDPTRDLSRHRLRLLKDRLRRTTNFLLESPACARYYRHEGMMHIRPRKCGCVVWSNDHWELY
jgi:hypothetical protein